MCSIRVVAPARGWSGASALLALWLALGSGVAAAQAPACKESCEAERKKTQGKLEECLREVDPIPPDRAAKMKLLCRERFVPPRCDGLPPCKKERPQQAAKPRMRLGPMVFSLVRRGPALDRAIYAPGDELFMRVDVDVRSKPDVNRVWLRMNLRLLALDSAGKTQEVGRWDSYAEEQKLIEPAERGLELRFTLHGGLQLPKDLDLGGYQLEAEVREAASGFLDTARGRFSVARATRPAAR